jgi:aminoglycoside phosphotransferase (APT) family kinase protein
MLVQRHLYQSNYPVAEPLFVEESCAYLGGPFLIMARVPGPTLLAGSLRRPWKLFRSPVRMAEAQVRLHLLDTAGFPRCEGPLLDRRLDELAALIGDHGLQGLRPGLDWLIARRPAPALDPRILHLDFHPLNLIESPSGSLVVLDWNEADVGDRHADVGTTLMLMECLPPIHVTRLELFFVRMGRLVFLPQYLHAYRRHLPLEEDKLAYYRAQAAFRRLCNYGRWLRDGPEISGNKPAMLQCITDGHRQTLERYFWKWTGVRVQL